MKKHGLLFLLALTLGPGVYRSVAEKETGHRPDPGLLSEVTRDLMVEKRYLNLPVKNGATKRRLSFLVDGRPVREFEIELADAQPDFWVFLDLAPFKGYKATIKIDHLLENSPALNAIEQASEIKGAENLYHEKWRPQFHFSSRRGWNNDPNGLVYSQGEYHLFYQHNPYGWDWGNMHWGHAVSPDLVHWKELPVALYPHGFGDWAFSGSAVMDKRNLSGFKTGAADVMVAAYTSTGRGECLAFSNDRGRTWTDYPGNPVVKHQGRDPRLFWHPPTQRWVMAVYDEAEGKRWIAFYASPDFRSWEFQSRIEGFFECPDLFELPVDGNPANKKWVLTDASSAYLLGAFDGRKFTPETPKLPGHRGEGFYAAQTFSDLPDGRCVQMGWGQMAAPGMPFNQMMTFPCKLNLRTTRAGLRLCWQPVRELEKLRAKTRRFPAQTLKPGDNPLARIRGELFDLRAEYALDTAEIVSIKVGGVAVIYNAKKNELVCKNYRAPLLPSQGKVRLQILVDRTSLEIFANDGEVFMPVSRPLKNENEPPVIRSEGGTARIHFLEIRELKPTWR